MKAILVIGDGMADRPLKVLNGKTPLEAAEKPSLNHIAENGICGILDPIAPGIPPGSDVATLALLGYDALKVYAGRGALEALGVGVEILPNDVTFRCNFATVDDKLTVLDRRAGRIETKDASQLAETLKQVSLRGHPEIEVMFKNTVQHRAILRLRGAGRSIKVSDSDPHSVDQRVLDVHALDSTPEARKTAGMVNELMQHFHKILKEHPLNKEREKRGLLPANIVLCRGAGKLPHLTSLPHRYGIRAAAIGVMPLFRGVCKVAGMELIDVPGATGTYDSDLMAKGKAAVRVIQSYDFVFVHVKATDLASHDGKVKEKVGMIEKIDEMMGWIIKNVDLSQTFVAVTADHTTSSVTREHEGDPVPVVLMGPGVRVDDVKEFGERACAKGGLGRIRGKDLMPIIMNLMGKVKRFGA